MKHSAIAGYLYPTTAVFVDDSEHFLTQTSLELDVDLPYVLFSQPGDVLNYIHRYGQTRPFVEQYKPFVDSPALLAKLSDAHRFSEPTVFIVDFAMQGIDGLELCAKIKATMPHAKTIMLTGQAGEDTGTQGLSNGILDRFLIKEDPDISHPKLFEAIRELQMLFFTEQTSSLGKSAPCLTDPTFSTFLTQLCHKHHIAERYLLTEKGDFLLLKYDGTPLWLSNNKVIDTPLIDIQEKPVISFQQYLYEIWPPM